MKLGNFEIPTEQIGDLWALEGIVISNGHSDLIMVLPFSDLAQKSARPTHVVTPSDEEWQEWLKQSDDPVTPIGKKMADGSIVKALIRKCTRQVDQSVVWKVYQRDNYTCRYCGATGVPLTVDHYLAQTFGGLTTYENLLTSCRPCNKKKGHMTIDEWKVYCAKHGLKAF